MRNEENKILAQLIEDTIISELSYSNITTTTFMNRPKIQELILVLNELNEQYSLEIDSSNLIYEVMFAIGNKCFLYTEDAKIVLKEFHKLRMELPNLLERLFKERQIWDDFLEEIVEKDKWKWSEIQEKEYLGNKKLEVESRTFDRGSQLKYLEAEINSLVLALRSIEDDNKAYFNLKNLYNGDIFVADAEDLNWYFFVGIKEIRLTQLWKYLSDLIDSKNKVRILKKYLFEIGRSGELKPVNRNQKIFLDEYLKERLLNIGKADSVVSASRKAGYSPRNGWLILQKLEINSLIYDKLTEIRPFLKD
jgi:hypothetical protein